MPDTDDDDIIIIRRAQRSPKTTIEERAFLGVIEADLMAKTKVHSFDRWRVRRILDKVLFGP